MTEPVHVSEIKNFLRCRLAWFWSAPYPRGKNLEPRVPKGALHFGRLIHKALQEHYDFGVPSWKAYSSALDESEKEIATYRGKLWQHEVEEMQKLRNLGIAMLRGYDAWAFKADREWQFVALETAWKLDFTRTFKLAGRFDAIVKLNSGVWVLDFKTTSFYSADWTAQDLQATTYVMAARSLLGVDVKGVIFRFLRKKAPLCTSELLLKRGGLTQAKDVPKKTTLGSYELALAVATLADMQGVDLQENPKTIEAYEELLTAEDRKKQKWYDDFIKQYSLVRKMYWDTLQALSERNTFYWNQYESRSQEQVDRYLKFVIEPAAREMRSRRKGRWIGPTGLGAAFSVCANCVFRTPCKLVMDGGDFRKVLREEFQERKREKFSYKESSTTHIGRSA